MTVSTETVAGLYEELARERSRESLSAFEKVCGDPGRAVAALTQMASTLEDAAAVATLVARESTSLAAVREPLDGVAAALIELAGRLEEAADLGQR